MTRRAFTLIELLVVIGIIIVLMSLILAGIGLAKKQALKAKTVSQLGAVASAIDQYRSLNNVWPERLIVTATMVTELGLDTAFTDKDAYALVFADTPGVKPAKDVGADGWKAVNLALVRQLGDLAVDQASDGLFLDSYKEPLRYRPSKWYPYATGSAARIDSDKPPGQDSYQLWSAGADLVDDQTNPGEAGDDIPQWTRLP